MTSEGPPSEAEIFYASALQLLVRGDAHFLIGGAFAMREYGDIYRDTKDLDVFCNAADCPRLLKVFEAGGYETEMTDPNWLAKAKQGDHFVDLIFGSANARCPSTTNGFITRAP